MSTMAGSDRSVNAAAACVPAARVASRMMGHLAHDLRSPVMVIRGYLKMMSEGRIGPVTEKQQECLRIAMESVQRLAQLATVSARGSEVVGQTHPVNINLQELWRRAALVVQPKIAEKGIRVKERSPSVQLNACGDAAMLDEMTGRLVGAVVSSMARDRELHVEYSRHHSGDVAITLMAGCDDSAAAAEIDWELQSAALLMGGKLTLDRTMETVLAFRLSLPGSAA